MYPASRRRTSRSPSTPARSASCGSSTSTCHQCTAPTAARDSLTAAAADLRAVNPAGYEAAAAKVEELLGAIEDRKPPAQVKQLAAEAQAAIAAASGSDESGG